MPVYKAVKTLDAINEALEKDGGASFRENLRKTMPNAEDAYRGEEDRFRSHLGASLIGRECARELWYSFHWALKKEFSGRMIRLFNRGHLEEARFAALLWMIGCKVYQHDEQKSQFRISGVDGHYGGGLDAVIENLPDIPDEPVLGEFKTHNTKSFISVAEDGVRKAKFEHYVQMQQYMGYYGLRWAAYFAVNKNDDDLHVELVPFDPENRDQFYDRAQKIIAATEPPVRISQDPSWFKCRFCDMKPVCHLGVAPEKNCRTCVHSKIGPDGEWLCTHPTNDAAFGDNVPLTKDQQLQGCDLYELNPSFSSK